jgi:aryl-alcohol dehydrogenase-like predicted oxidoreductase
VTKGGLPTRPGLKSGRDSRYQTVIEDCETSLRNLDTDYIDLYLIHWPDTETPFEEPMQALTDLVAAGKVRYIGVSSFNAEQLTEQLRARVVVMRGGDPMVEQDRNRTPPSRCLPPPYARRPDLSKRRSH